MLNRIIGVFKLDVNTFEEIEHDQGATTQAAMIVALVAFISAIGSGLGASMSDSSFMGSFIGTLLWTFVGWLLWSAVSYFVGTTFFGGQADLGEMLRVIGFAFSPQILGIIPCFGAIVGAIWSLIAGFIAVRQGLDVDNTKVFLTIAVGFIVYMLGMWLIGTLVGGATSLMGF